MDYGQTLFRPAVLTRTAWLQFHFGATGIPLFGISGKLCVS